MPPVARANKDNSTGHGCFPPNKISSGSDNVYTNNLETARKQDPMVPHGCADCIPHGGIISEGSGKVYVNNMPIARIGDPISCGEVIAEGSGNVTSS